MRPRYSMEIYDRGVGLRLNVRMVKAEATETLLCGCVTWSPSKAHCDKLRQAHLALLLRCLGWRKRKRLTFTLPYTDALLSQAPDSAEATVDRRRCMVF